MIQTVYKELSDIFDSVNNTLCADCPEANCKSQKEYMKKMGSHLSSIPNEIRDTYIYSTRSKEAGCCTFCAEKKGHLRHAKGDPSFDSVKEYFDEEYGFFDNEKKVCKLSREKRSWCCLQYTCDSMKDILGQSKVDRLTAICGTIKNTRKE